MHDVMYCIFSDEKGAHFLSQIFVSAAKFAQTRMRTAPFVEVGNSFVGLALCGLPPEVSSTAQTDIGRTIFLRVLRELDSRYYVL